MRGPRPFWRGRRGTTMVEATVVLPLIILSILTCVLIAMFFYETAFSQCQLHRALRCQAGSLTGHTADLGSHRPEGDDLTVSRSGVFSTVSGRRHTAMTGWYLMLRHRPSADIESRWHASDGVTYVRYCTLGKKAIGLK